MKASIKFRDDQKPLLRAKVPINILSFPFQSSVVCGDSKDLSLNLSTHFDFGPCFKFSYKPNNPQNPFAVVCKTGIGHYGSPNSSPFVMSAEFNLIGNQNPKFFLHFKPQIGDFLAKKSCSSVEFRKSNELVNDKGMKNEFFSGNGKIGNFSVDSGVGLVGNLFDGMKMSARTVLPLGKRVGVNFKWGVRVPGETVSDMVVVGRKGDWVSGIDKFKNVCPVLVMNKIGIEQVSLEESKERDVGEVCLNMKKQLEVIQGENGLLRKALDDLRADIAEGKGWKSSGGGRADGRNNVDKKLSGLNAYGGKGAEEGRCEELKNA